MRHLGGAGMYAGEKILHAGLDVGHAVGTGLERGYITSMRVLLCILM